MNFEMSKDNVHSSIETLLRAWNKIGDNDNVGDMTLSLKNNCYIVTINKEAVS